MRFVFQEEEDVTSFCGAGASGLMDSVERQREGEGGTADQSKYGKIRIQRNKYKTAFVIACGSKILTLRGCLCCIAHP